MNASLRDQPAARRRARALVSSASRKCTSGRPVPIRQSPIRDAALPSRFPSARSNRENLASFPRKPCAGQCLPARCGNNRRGKSLSLDRGNKTSIQFQARWSA